MRLIWGRRYLWFLFGYVFIKFFVEIVEVMLGVLGVIFWFLFEVVGWGYR